MVVPVIAAAAVGSVGTAAAGTAATAATGTAVAGGAGIAGSTTPQIMSALKHAPQLAKVSFAGKDGIGQSLNVEAESEGAAKMKAFMSAKKADMTQDNLQDFARGSDVSTGAPEPDATPSADADGGSWLPDPQRVLA